LTSYPTVHQAIDAALPEHRCPSTPYGRWKDPNATTPGNKAARCDYSGMLATCGKQTNYNSAAAYGNITSNQGPIFSLTPDGALLPAHAWGSGFITISGTLLADIQDGTAHTIACVEKPMGSISTSNNSGRMSPWDASWVIPAFTHAFGLPNAVCTPIGVVKNTAGYYAPVGHTAGYYDDDNAATVGMRTLLAYDWENPPDNTFYSNTAEYPAKLACNGSTMYGPGSGHPSVVNHLFCDGSTKSIAKTVDVCVYFFLITRKNKDPFIPPPS
jgi:hypothetical protein